MKKIYYLKTCNTCTHIINELNLSSGFVFQDIKEQEITARQLEEMYKLSGSFESLFSKRAKLYKAMDLKNQSLNEKDFKHYILHHYTFLKRPVIIIWNKIFIGNSKKVVNEARQFLNEQ
jgi:arsenate reductase (glutaredoxin)